MSDFLSAMCGATCWGVRSEMDALLIVEFGDPFLSVREPRALPADASPGMVRALGRRLAVPRGHWHLFVEDGAWRIAAGGSTCARFETVEAEQAACFAHLSGQRLERFAWDEAGRRWLLEFDLGGSLTIARPQHPSEAQRDQWSVFREDGVILACVKDETMAWEPPPIP